MRRCMTRKQLKKELRYDHNTGIFFNCKSGNVTGTLDPDGYTQLRIAGIRYKADEVAWFYIYGEWPKHPVVHINGINSDDWISNLKTVIVKKPAKNNKSKVTGVYFDEKNSNWRAQILKDRKQKSLGSYKNFDLAVLARYKAEVLYGYKPDSTAYQYIKKMFM